MNRQRSAVEFRHDYNLDCCDFMLLLPTENEQIESVFLRKLDNRKGIVVRKQEAQRWLELYSLYEFSDKVIIGSFDEPYGRKLRNLLECGLATEDELIRDVILGAM